MFLKIHGRTPRLMNEAGDADGGGGDTVIDDADENDRGDEVEGALDPEALARVVGDDGEEEGAEPPKKDSKHVPIGRFNEVNEAKKALERENAELKARAAAPKEPEKKEPEKAKEPEFDEDKAERQYATLLAEGDFDKAVALRKDINKHLREQAREEAERNVEGRIEARTTVQTLTSVAQQAVKDWPYLDTEEGADTMELILAARDGMHAKGVPLPEALKQAVAKIAPKFAPEGGGTPGKDSSKVDPAKDTRTLEAIKRGADASTRQPPKLDGGAGNRAGKDKVNIEDLDEDQFDALPDAEKRRLRGDEG